MMRSLYSGVAGLRTHQTKMDVIGNNIANVNTTAYKSQSVTFRDLMYQTTQRASGANAETGVGGTNARQIGLGVTTGAINTAIAQQGSAQTTNNPFDIMITGSAFFVVNNGQENLFTRDGSFYVDGAGNLAMTSTGYNVMGWAVDPETGEPKPQSVSPLKIMSEEWMTYEPAATTQTRITGIIDKNDTRVHSSSGRIMQMEFYDIKGYKYTAKMSIHATTDGNKFYTKLDDIVDSTGKSMGADLSQVSFGGNLDVDVSVAYTLVNGSATGDGNFTITGGGGKYTGSLSTTPLSTPAAGTELDALKAAYGADSADFENILTFEIAGDGTLKVLTEKAGTSPTIVGATYSPANGTFTTDSVKASDGTVNLSFEPGKTVDAKAYAKVPANKNDLETLYGLDIDAEGVNTFVVNADGTLTVTNQTVSNSINLVYNPVNGKFVSAGGNSSGNITMSFGSLPNFENINIDFSQTQNVNNKGSSTVAPVKGTSDGLGAGRMIGDMINISIDKQGIIYASYDNGMRRCLGQIATAVFANPSGLEKQGDNLYNSTMNSGDFDGQGVDITEDGGYMNTGVLEMSNVDLSAEFTEMITTQRGFQANSRIITVSDTMLEELTNLKR